MADLREVFEMTTKQMEPDQDSWRQQEDRQRKAGRNKRVGAFVVAATVVIAAAGLVLTQVGSEGGAPADPTVSFPPTGHPRAVMRPAIVGLDGTVIQHANLAPDAWEPNLSPDGQRIVYVTRSTSVGFCGGCGDRNRLTMARVDGKHSGFLYYEGGGPQGGIHRLHDVSQPIWSPDGTEIAFVAGDPNGLRSQIVVLHVAAAIAHPSEMYSIRATTLTSGPTQKSWPSWSPDGTSIIYSDAGSTPLDDNGFSPTQEIYRVAASGGGAPVRITTNEVDDSQAVYSPDGSSIALFHGGGLATMEPDGSHVQAILSQRGFSPRWSPDGSKIAFLTYNDVQRYQLPDPSTGTLASWPRLDVKVFDIATGTVSDLGMSVASDENAVSWTPKGNGLLVNRAYDPRN